MIALTLRTARTHFTEAITLLVAYMISQGYEVALDEGMTRVTEKVPQTNHMPGSLHEIGLAQDIDLYKNGIYLSETEDHAAFGLWWEDYGVEHGLPLACGGNFKDMDANHYSLRWGGKS